ncbi:MAG TPA: hypothetical protein VH140_11005 [Candidatus Acidoferrum sp.]|nr:hypothetical protein [Candidatus Acidoferrum sp.]
MELDSARAGVTARKRWPSALTFEQRRWHVGQVHLEEGTQRFHLQRLRAKIQLRFNDLVAGG